MRIYVDCARSQFAFNRANANQMEWFLPLFTPSANTTPIHKPLVQPYQHTSSERPLLVRLRKLQLRINPPGTYPIL